MLFRSKDDKGILHPVAYFSKSLNSAQRNYDVYNRELLGRLQKLDLYLKPDKCIFETDRVKFLGVILENGAVTMDPIKVAGVADWKTPKNVRDIRKFLGFVNFYRRFIPNHSKKAKPMNDLLKKGVPFEWKQEQEDAFQELKQVVQKEPVLLQPDQKKPFEVEIDASNHAIGAVLMQKDVRNPSPSGLLFQVSELSTKELRCLQS